MSIVAGEFVDRFRNPAPGPGELESDEELVAELTPKDVDPLPELIGADGLVEFDGETDKPKLRAIPRSETSSPESPTETPVPAGPALPPAAEPDVPPPEGVPATIPATTESSPDTTSATVAVRPTEMLPASLAATTGGNEAVTGSMPEFAGLVNAPVNADTIVPLRRSGAGGLCEGTVAEALKSVGGETTGTMAIGPR